MRQQQDVSVELDLPVELAQKNEAKSKRNVKKATPKPTTDGIIAPIVQTEAKIEESAIVPADEEVGWGTILSETDVLSSENNELDLALDELSTSVTTEEETDVVESLPDFDDQEWADLIEWMGAVEEGEWNDQAIDTAESQVQIELDSSEEADEPNKLVEPNELTTVEESPRSELDVTFSEAIQELQPEQIETVLAVVETISELSQEIFDLRLAGADLAIEKEQELLELCEQLFEHMQLEFNQEMVRDFIRQIIVDEISKRSVDAPELTDMGTYEQKSDNQALLNRIAGLLKQKVLFSALLGRLAIRLQAA